MVNFNASHAQLVDYQSALVYSGGVSIPNQKDLVKKIYNLKPTDIIVLACLNKTESGEKPREFVLKFSNKHKLSFLSSPSLSSKKYSIQYRPLANPLSINFPKLIPKHIPNPLHLSIVLRDQNDGTLIKWEGVATEGREVGISIANPNPSLIRVVTHVVDVSEKFIPIKGLRVVDLPAGGSKFVCSFTVPKMDQVMFHFLASKLPLVTGAPLFHNCLSVNVKPINL